MSIDSASTILEADQGPWGTATATFDTTRRYRYSLSRTWNEDRSKVTWIMLNPSTATATDLDPTINRVLRFSRDWGHDSAVVVNLFALRATRPARLARHEDPVGPLNDEAIETVVTGADQVLAAWGTRGAFLDREATVTSLLTSLHVETTVLGLTKGGHPRHPLYVPRVTRPRPWSLATD